MYPPRKAPTTTRSTPRPPHPPPGLRFSQWEEVGEQMAPRSQESRESVQG